MELIVSSDPRDKLRDNNISFKEEGNGDLMLKDHDGFKINIKYQIYAEIIIGILFEIKSMASISIAL